MQIFRQSQARSPDAPQRSQLRTRSACTRCRYAQEQPESTQPRRGRLDHGAANAGLTNTVDSALAIDPITPQTLYAGTRGGVFKSTDAGATWSTADAGLPSPVSAWALAIDPITPQTLYAGTGKGVFESTDAGATWSAAGLPNWVPALAIDPVTPRTLYAGTDGGAGVFKSADAGSTWNARNTGLVLPS